MKFDWTDEQLALRESVVRFAQHELSSDIVARDHDSSFDDVGWKKCAAMGLQAMAVPEEYGGSGADVLSIIVALEALGYGCTDNGLIFSLNAHMWACEYPIVRFGTEDQKRCRRCDTRRRTPRTSGKSAAPSSSKDDRSTAQACRDPRGSPSHRRNPDLVR